MTRPIIEIENLTKRYNERTVLQGLSLSIVEGEIFGLLGPNGAGKSTTISILAGLIAADEGMVKIGGFDIAHDLDRIKSTIGFVPQDLALYPTLSAKDNLAFFGQIYGLGRNLLKERVAWALDLVRLSDRANDSVHSFSGGMQRRLNIAVGLIHKPRILFLDEPTVGVDPQSRNFIFEHVEQLKAGGMTILYTTHYMEEAERLCDRVAIVDEGRVLALDTPHGLISLLGNGIIRAAVPPDAVKSLMTEIQSMPPVAKITAGSDGRLTMETKDSRPALIAFIEVCGRLDIPILSLEVLETSLESVFLHLTGKRLRE